jgi:hypothetical protein
MITPVISRSGYGAAVLMLANKDRAAAPKSFR